jgi:cell division inhibitor SepF
LGKEYINNTEVKNMSFMEKLKNIMGVPEDEQFEDDDVDIIVKKDQAPASPVSDLSKRNKVVNIHTTAQLQVVLVKPERFEDASSIADHLNEKRTLVLNLESTNKDVSRRLVDFLSGVAYANNGQIKRVANSTFIITPYNVDVMGDLLDELENNGVFF